MNMGELLDQYGSTVRLSHLTLAGKGADPSNFIGQTLKVKVLDRDKRRHRLVFSRREVLEDLLNADTAPETVSHDKIACAREIMQALSSEHFNSTQQEKSCTSC